MDRVRSSATRSGRAAAFTLVLAALSLVTPAHAGLLNVVGAERSISSTVGPHAASSSDTSGTFDQQFQFRQDPQGPVVATVGQVSSIQASSVVISGAGAGLVLGEVRVGTVSVVNHIDFSVGAGGLDFDLLGNFIHFASADLVSAAHVALGIIDLQTLTPVWALDLFDGDIQDTGSTSASGTLAAGTYRFVADLEVNLRRFTDVDLPAGVISTTMNVQFDLSETGTSGNPRLPPNGVPTPATAPLALLALALCGAGRRRR